MAIPELLPLHDLIAKCNRCGFCQAGCPVFRVTGEEHSLSRGRLAVARGLMLGNLELTPEVMHALEDCLLCRGCTAHCFPALKTDEIVTDDPPRLPEPPRPADVAADPVPVGPGGQHEAGVGRPHGASGPSARAWPTWPRRAAP